MIQFGDYLSADSAQILAVELKRQPQQKAENIDQEGHGDECMSPPYRCRKQPK